MTLSRRTLSLILMGFVLLATLACGITSETVEDVSGNIASTAQAVAAQAGENIQFTAQAAAIQVGENFQATMAAMLATGVSVGTPPADIPIMAEHTNFFGSELQVAYQATLPFDEVLAFYQAQMPTYGWTQISPTYVLENQALLTYSSGTRQATVVIAESGDGTNVGISIDNTP
jgi:hypothetical protein